MSSINLQTDLYCMLDLSIAGTILDGIFNDTIRKEKMILKDYKIGLISKGLDPLTKIIFWIAYLIFIILIYVVYI